MIPFARKPAILLLAFSIFAGCGKPAPEPASKAPKATPTPQKLTLPLPTAVNKPSSKHTEEMEQEDTVPALITSFMSGKDEADQIEIIQKLSNMETSESIQALSALFRETESPDMKSEILSSISSLEKETPARMALVQEGLVPSQAPEVRQAASDTLFTIDDPGTIMIWKTLLKDPDDTIRKTAEAMMELNQPVK